MNISKENQIGIGCRAVKLPWVFTGGSLTFDGAPGNIQVQLCGYNFRCRHYNQGNHWCDNTGVILNVIPQSAKYVADDIFALNFLN